MGNISALKFIKYEISKIEFHKNETFNKPKKPLDIDYNFNINTSLMEDSIVRVDLTCNVFENPNKNNYPFGLTITITGIFDIKNIKGKDEKDLLVKYNTVAILLPYLRASITIFTSVAGFPTLNIPLINVYNLINSNQDTQNE